MEIKPPLPPPYDLKKNDADQKILAARHNPSSRERARAEAVIKESQGVDLSPKQKTRYADALAAMGRYTEAYEISGNEKFKKISEAFGNRECSCPDTEEVRVVDNKLERITHSRLFERSKIFHDGKRVSLMMCRLCSNLTCADN